jgi:hypothetical protein
MHINYMYIYINVYTYVSYIFEYMDIYIYGYDSWYVFSFFSWRVVENFDRSTIRGKD